MSSDNSQDEQHTFQTDLYNQLLEDLKGHLEEGIEEVIHPFSKDSKFGFLQRWWFTWFVIPSLVTGLFFVLLEWGPVSTISTFTKLLLPASTRTAGQIENVDLLAMLWLARLCQIPLALFGGWLGIGAGKLWRNKAMLAMMIILLLIFVSPPNSGIDMSSSLLEWPQNIVFGVGVWILTAVSYGLGVQIGRFVSLLAETWYPFRKVFPAAGGRPVPKVTFHAYQLLRKRLAGADNLEADLDYVLTSAQAHLDASETMSLPWGILIAVFSLEFIGSNLPAFLSAFVQMLLAVLVLIVLMGVSFIAYHATLQTCIIQAVAQIRREEDVDPRPEHEFDTPILGTILKRLRTKKT